MAARQSSPGAGAQPTPPLSPVATPCSSASSTSDSASQNDNYNWDDGLPDPVVAWPMDDVIHEMQSNAVLAQVDAVIWRMRHSLDRLVTGIARDKPAMPGHKMRATRIKFQYDRTDEYKSKLRLATALHDAKGACHAEIWGLVPAPHWRHTTPQETSFLENQR